MLVQPANNGKVLRVLDIASPGTAARGYLDSSWAKRMPVRVKSITALNPNESDEQEGNVTLVRTGGRLPAILYDEQDKAYQHVHFHMLNAQGIIEVREADAMLFHIGRIMGNDGVFFFSMDHAFFTFAESTGLLASESEGYLKTMERIITGRFAVQFSFCDLERARETHEGHAKAIMAGNRGMQAVNTPKVREIAAEFGVNTLEHTRESVDAFYRLFSNDAKMYGEYFVIATKKSE